MKPAPFQYFDPTSVGEVIGILKLHESEAKIVAGGQSLMPLMNMRLARPGVLVDVNRLSQLDYIRESDGGLAIGATTRQRTVELSELVKEHQPMLRAATLFVGHPQIRNRGTVGGSLAHADPAAEYPAVAVALGAVFTVVGSSGERNIAADDFFVTNLTTALKTTDMLTEVRFPAQSSRTGWSFLEVARRHGDFALAGVAATVTIGEKRNCTASRIVLFGVGPIPVRAGQAEEMLVGANIDDRLIDAVGAAASIQAADSSSDIHGSAEYRQHLAMVLTRRALAQAWSRATAAGKP